MGLDQHRAQITAEWLDHSTGELGRARVARRGRGWVSVVATTSWGVAESLGYEDHEDAPADEMLAAAARIARGVEVPVTVDAEAGYGMEPAELVAALRSAGAAGCNLDDTDHAAGSPVSYTHLTLPTIY